MIDIKLLRTDFAGVEKNIKLRNKEYKALNLFKKIDANWRKFAANLQTLNAENNILSTEIGVAMKNGDKKKAETLKKTVASNKTKIDKLQKDSDNIQEQLRTIMFSIPNLLHTSVPVGKDETENIVVKKTSQPKKFDFTPLAHWDLGVKSQLIDFERGVKVSGSRMYYLTGKGAELMRALKNFTLDTHIQAGYTEILPPVIMNDIPLYGLGKLPLFEEDMYKTNDRQFLSGTEEHPLTAMYMNEVIDEKKLPIKLTSSIVSFRREAGSAGRDTKGILRVHQFYNTELVNFSTPEQSWKLLDEMVSQATKILDLLKIPYEVVLLCSGDTGESSSKTFDINVWVPSENKYREISSCSNCLDYQARGMGIKYKNGTKTDFVHTLNGTGTSLNRLWIAIVENFQNQDGTIDIPEPLQKYMFGKKKI